jgi:hypothetical protein
MNPVMLSGVHVKGSEKWQAPRYNTRMSDLLICCCVTQVGNTLPLHTANAQSCLSKAGLDALQIMAWIKRNKFGFT